MLRKMHFIVLDEVTGQERLFDKSIEERLNYNHSSWTQRGSKTNDYLKSDDCLISNSMTVSNIFIFTNIFSLLLGNL